MQAARKHKYIIPIINNKWKFGLPATKNFNFNRYSGMYIIESKFTINWFYYVYYNKIYFLLC